MNFCGCQQLHKTINNTKDKDDLALKRKQGGRYTYPDGTPQQNKQVAPGLFRKNQDFSERAKAKQIKKIRVRKTKGRERREKNGKKNMGNKLISSTLQNTFATVKCDIQNALINMGPSSSYSLPIDIPPPLSYRAKVNKKRILSSIVQPQLPTRCSLSPYSLIANLHLYG